MNAKLPGDDGPAYHNKLTEGGPPVQVSIGNLTQYAGQMFNIAMHHTGAQGKAFGHMGMTLEQGVAMPQGDAGYFAEGRMLAQLMGRRIGDFQAFFGDVGKGLEAISNAAQVVAYSYDGAEGENKASLGDISYAFGDSGATRPKGLDERLLQPGGKTMDQIAYENSQKAENSAGALAGMHGDNTNATMAPGEGNVLTSPDGSYLVVGTERVATPYGYVNVTTQTVYGKDGKVIQKNTESQFNAGGSQTHTTKEERDKGSVTTEVTKHPDGSTTITTTTTYVGADGKPQTPPPHTTTIPADSHRPDGPKGPVEQAEQDLGSKGDTRSQQAYGIGY